MLQFDESYFLTPDEEEYTPSGLMGMTPRREYAEPIAPVIQEEQPQDERDWGQALQDTAIGLTQGAIDFVTVPYEILDLISNGALERTTGFGEENLQRSQDILQDLKSKALQERERRVAEADGFMETVGTSLSEPSTIAQGVVRSLPSMLTPMGMGRAGGAMAAKGLAGEAAEIAAKKGATRGAVGGIMATEGGLNAFQAKQQVLSAEPVQLYETSQDFRDMVDGGMGIEEAQGRLADDVAQMTMAVTAPIAGVAGKLTGAAKFEGGLGSGMNTLSGGVASRAGGGALREGSEETIQSGSGQFGQNVAEQQYVDPSQELFEGVPEAAGVGLTTGTAMGAGMGAISKPAVGVNEQGEPVDEDGQLVGPMPFRGPMYEAQGKIVPSEVTRTSRLGEPTPEQRNDMLMQQAEEPSFADESLFITGRQGTLGRPTPVTPPTQAELNQEQIDKQSRYTPNVEPVDMPEYTQSPAEPTLEEMPISTKRYGQKPVPLTKAQKQARENERTIQEAKQPTSSNVERMPASYSPYNSEADTTAEPRPDYNKINTKLQAVKERKNRPSKILKGKGAFDWVTENKPDRVTKAGSEYIAKVVNDAGKVSHAKVTQSVYLLAQTAGIPTREMSPAVYKRTLQSETKRFQREGSKLAQAMRKPAVDTKAKADTELPKQAPDGGGRVKVQAPKKPATSTVTRKSKLFGDKLADVNVEPTSAQIESGNYKKGHVKLEGMDIAVENPKGSERKGVDDDGKEWSSKMKDHYGYFKNTKGFDKDQVDVFIKDHAKAEGKPVFVINQNHPKTGKFDEHKVMMGYDNSLQARKAYLQNYDKGWKGLGSIQKMPLDEFKTWVKSTAPKKGAVNTKDDAMSPQAPKAKPIPKPETKPEGKPTAKKGDIVDVTMPNGQKKQALFVAQEGRQVRVRVLNPEGNPYQRSILLATSKVSASTAVPKFSIEKKTDGIEVGEASIEEFMQAMDAQQAGQTEENRVLDLAELVSGDNHFFKYKSSKAKSIHQIAKTIFPHITIAGEAPTFMEKNAWRIHSYDAKTGKTNEALLYLRDRDTHADMTPNKFGKPTLELDISKFKSGSGGNQVYHLVSTFAHNNGYVFMGDTSGVSPIARYRRTENMLSSAMRFGTTEHLHPHAQQRISWKLDDPDFNMVQLLKKSVDNTLHNVPKLRGLTYVNESDARTEFNGDRAGFYDTKTKEPVGDEYFAELISWKTNERAKESGIGSTTAKRAVFLNSILQGQRGERPNVLARFASELLQSVNRSTAGIFYSIADKPTTHLSQAYVEDKVEELSRKWKNPPPIKVYPKQQDLPYAIRKLLGDDNTTPGFYQNGKVNLVAENLLSDTEIEETLFHEALGHYGLEQLFGNQLPKELDNLYSGLGGSKALNKIAKEQGVDLAAYRKILYAAEGGMENLSAQDKKRILTEELLAHMAVTNTLPSRIKKILGTIRQWLREHGFKKLLTYNDADLIHVLTKAREAVVNGDFNKRRKRPAMFSLGEQTVHDRVLDTGIEDYESFSAKTYAKPVSMYQRIMQDKSSAWNNAVNHFRTGFVDSYDALLRQDIELFGKDVLAKNIDHSAYAMAKMSNAAHNALNTIINYSRITLGDDGLIKPIHGSDSLHKIMSEVGDSTEIRHFMNWIAANRAAKLRKEERENLFTDKEIRATVRINTAVAGRKQRWDAAYKKFNQHQKDVLAIAQKSGILSKEEVEQFSKEFYVPFYRVVDDKEAGISTPTGLTRQRAYRKLKGGTEPLGDLLQNSIANMTHLVEASLKNQAGVKAIDNSVHAGVAQKVVAEQARKGEGTYVLREGKKEHYNITDPLVYKAIVSLTDVGMQNFMMKTMRYFKRGFTGLTTATPQFMMSNFLRDAVHTAAIGSTGKTFGEKIRSPFRGVKEYNKDNPVMQTMLAAGGAFHFGHINANDADIMGSLIDDELRKTIYHDPKHLYAEMKKQKDKYMGLGNRLENANRFAIYEQALKEGKSELQAAFESRDLLDFTSKGAYPAVRWLTDIVPFLNARIQGLDVLYRKGLKPTGNYVADSLRGQDPNASDKEIASRFSALSGSVMLMSMALFMAYKDDEDFKRRAGWDRDMYWWFKIGDTEFRIPKPFEIGALGTLAERSLEQAVDDSATGRLFAERMGHMLENTFSFNPVPQMFNPMVNLYANKDSFTDMIIESQGMKRLSPSRRTRANTTEFAKQFSAGLENTFGAVLGKDSMVVLSPVQIDYLIQSYLGGIGAMANNISNSILVEGLAKGGLMAEKPEKGFLEYQPFRRFFKAEGTGNSRYIQDVYDKMRKANTVYADLRDLARYGETEKAMQLMKDKKQVLLSRTLLNKASSTFTQINQQIKFIQKSDMTSKMKRKLIDDLQKKKEAFAKLALGKN